MKFSASMERPLSMYVNDYDQNGRTEPIVEWYFGTDDKPYPFASKMDLTAQLPKIKKAALKYSEYAQKQVKDMFSPQVLGESEYKEVVDFRTSIIENTGEGYIMKPMPTEAQLSPVFGIEIADLDKDGILDIFLGGNFYGLKPELGRHAAWAGGYFKGDGKGGFSYKSEVACGLRVEGQVRDAIYLNDQLFIARNNAPILTFKYRK